MWYFFGIHPADCAPARAPKKSRARAYPEQLDTLFTSLVVLGIFVFAATIYGGTGFSYFEQNPPNTFLDIVTAIGGSYSSALFLLSGYLAAVSLRRELTKTSKMPGSNQKQRARACWAFFKPKLLRFGLSATVYSLFGHPLTMAIASSHWWRTYRWYVTEWFSQPGVRGHTWICTMTLICDALLAAYTLLDLPPLPVQTYTPQLAFVLLPMVTFLWRHVFPLTIVYAPLNLRVGHLPLPFLAYVTGIFLSTRPHLVFPDKTVGTLTSWTSPLPAVVLCAAVGAFIHESQDVQDVFGQGIATSLFTREYIKFTVCVLNELCFVALTHTALRLSHIFTNPTPRGPRVLPRLAYGAFLVHATVCNYLAWEMRPVDFRPVPKTIIVGSLGTAISFGLSALLHRIPGVGKIIS